MLRSVLLAAHYGTSAQANAFTAATQIPLTCFDLLLSAAILGCFIPVYNSFRGENGDTPDTQSVQQADRFACVFLNFVLTITGIMTVLGILFADPLLSLISPSLSAQEHALGVTLLRIMFPMILFTGATYTLVGVLQSKNEFIIPSLVSCISNLGVILYFLLLDQQLGENGIYGVAIAYTVSWALQLVTLLFPLHRKGFRYFADFHFRSPQIKKVLRMCLPIMIGSWQAPLGVLLGTYFAPRLNVDGALTIFGYTNNLYVILTGILTYGICNYVFPKLSRMQALGDKESFCTTCQSGILSALAIVLPVMATVMILSREGVCIVYMRGAFSADAATDTAAALRMMAVGMPAYCLIELINRIMYAQTKTRAPMLAALAGSVCNLLFCLLLMQFASLRVGALTLANAAGQIVAAIALIFALLKNTKKIFTGQFLVSLFKLLGATLCSAAGMFVLYMILHADQNTCGLWRNLLTCCGVFLPGIGLYAVCLKLFGIKFYPSGKE